MKTLCALLFGLTGCTVSYGLGNRAHENNRKLLDLELGMSNDEVMAVMGEPDFNEAYAALQKTKVTIWFYYTTRGGDVEKRNCTPVVFADGKLEGWGREYYQRSAKKYEIDVNVRQGELKDK